MESADIAVEYFKSQESNILVGFAHEKCVRYSCDDVFLSP